MSGREGVQYPDSDAGWRLDVVRVRVRIRVRIGDRIRGRIRDRIRDRIRVIIEISPYRLRK